MRWIVALLLAFVLAGSAFGVAACAGSANNVSKLALNLAT
jgi:hypothetical protein